MIQQLNNLADDNGSIAAITKEGVIPSLVKLLQSGGEDQQLSAVSVLNKLAVNNASSAEIVRENAIPSFLGLYKLNLRN